MSKISFRIDHMDPLGQGVYKQNGKITFIAKTLPGESGTARVYKRSKGVQFAHVETLDNTAENRIEPECAHFQNCPSCNYLHTDYDSELVYKKQALLRQLTPLGITDDDIEVVGAPQRLGYRNRIQLHVKNKTLGLVDARTQRIIEIPHCQLVTEALRPELEQLYREDKSLPDGHCELYYRNHEAHVTWNKPYAHGGFTQVNTAMNEYLQGYVQKYAATKPYKTLLDLFSGDGNLSKPLMQNVSQRMMIDIDNREESPDYMALDLHRKIALKQFTEQCSQVHYDLMLIDPPRKGFAELQAWVKKCQPQQIIYVSCHAATLARDLKNMPPGYSIKHTVLLDMFPGTHHFETMVHLILND